MLQERIQLFADKIHGNIIADRRHLHRNPELSFHEFETAQFIRKRLSEIGIFSQSIHHTGVISMIKGEKPSDRVIALRADMDALPIKENNLFSFVSRDPLVMHACGHDAHMASLLGTAAILNEVKGEFGGTVKLIFQPGEEIIPGGAIGMIKEGVLENPKPEAIYGQHVMPSLPFGKIGICKGVAMASMDEIQIIIYGKGGHGAEPHKCTDPVLIASHIIVALQQIVSRNIDPIVPSVLTFGRVIADGAINIIPDKVHMEGTFRTFHEDWRDEAHIKMHKIATGLAESMGGYCEFSIKKGFPHLINHEVLSQKTIEWMGEYIGQENVVVVTPWMAAEDFSYYSHQIPGCFYFLGTRNEDKGIISSLHTASFTIEEDVLSLSAGLMAYVALRKLGN